jgi:hypothetical protein
MISGPTTSTCSTTALSLELGRVRCPHPAAVERMRRSLQQHGQLTPVVVIKREGELVLVDGFKRRTAARFAQ